MARKSQDDLGQLLARALGLHQSAQLKDAERLMAAVEKVCAAGVLTPDVGGTATTKQVTDAVIDAIHGSNV